MFFASFISFYLQDFKFQYLYLVQASCTELTLHETTLWGLLLSYFLFKWQNANSFLAGKFNFVEIVFRFLMKFTCIAPAEMTRSPCFQRTVPSPEMVKKNHESLVLEFSAGHKIIQRFLIKVHILFWEDNKILRNLHLTFDCMYCSGGVRWKFR